MVRTVSVMSVLLLGACAVAPPSGPTVLATPGKDKTFVQFQQDDATCRNYAQSVIGPTTPGQAGTNAAVGSAVVGTALGAAAGALIGSASGNLGAGAAIGAGTGLLLGTGVGAGNAEASSSDLQRRYDFGYIQCMTSYGDNVQTATIGPYAPAYGGSYPAYAYAPSYAYPPIVVAPPVVGFGFGFGGGGGYYGHRGYWGHPY